MIALCFRGALALICLTCVASNVGAEDNNGPRTLDDDDDNGFFRHSRQFYRFGRAFSPLWDNEDDSLSTKNRLIHWPGYPITPVVDDNVFSRHNRQFYRIGRAYPPYQDKRFLRFGRSYQPDSDEYTRTVFFHPDELLYRKRRSENIDTHSNLLHRTVRSAEANDKSLDVKNSLTAKDLQKRETGNDVTNILPHDAVLNEDKDLDKRFMRFGKRFMRFGRGDNEDAEYDKRFMRFGKSLGNDQDFEKRFMRFGKRFMRFGRGDNEDENDEKRFMRFGKSGYDDGDVDKRFMRFGKRFMRFGRGDEEDDDDVSEKFDKDSEDKRFMRFGKRSRRSSAIRSSSNSEASAAS